METYWKVNEVAAALQISAQTVYRYVANGEIPFHKLNRAVRFKPSEIESWIESRMPGAMAARNENLDGGLFAETKQRETEGGEV
jgi:excisionase family DNA binding protein